MRIDQQDKPEVDCSLDHISDLYETGKESLLAVKYNRAFNENELEGHYSKASASLKLLRDIAATLSPDSAASKSKDFLTLLRDANTARSPEFGLGGIDEISIEFKTIELAGEVGELSNIVKKMLRGDKAVHDKGIEVDIDTALKREIADVLICLDLLAAKYGYSLAEITKAKFNKTSADRGYQIFIQ